MNKFTKSPEGRIFVTSHHKIQGLNPAKTTCYYIDSCRVSMHQSEVTLFVTCNTTMARQTWKMRIRPNFYTIACYKLVWYI